MKVELYNIQVNSRGIEGYSETVGEVSFEAFKISKENDGDADDPKQSFKVDFETESECLKAYRAFNIPYGSETYVCHVDRYYKYLYLTPFQGHQLKAKVKDINFYEII